jgi:DNA-binding transcriptional LysR family regulator
MAGELTSAFRVSGEATATRRASLAAVAALPRRPQETAPTRERSTRKSPSRRKLRIELRALEVFVMVAETGNMTTAATRLSMTQPAVSQILSQLENQIGSPLLDRALRPLRLTPAGTALLENAPQLLRDAERLCRAAQLAAHDVLPRLRIGLVESFSMTAGAQLVRSLCANVDQLLVWSDRAADLRKQLLSRDLDLIVTPDDLDGAEGIERARVLRESYVALVPQSLVLPAGPVSLQELARRLPMIRFSARSQLGSVVDRHLRWQRLSVTKHLELDSAESVLALVAQGIGWTIVPPLCLLQSRGPLQRLRPVQLSGPELTRNMYVVYRSGEFEMLPQRVCEYSAQILSGELSDRLRSVAPWLTEHFRVC